MLNLTEHAISTAQKRKSLAFKTLIRMIMKNDLWVTFRFEMRYTLSLASFLWDMGKQCKPRSDATERGV